MSNSQAHDTETRRSPAHGLEDAARLLEVERGNWWQAIDVLLKVMVIYLAILAALIGYVLSANLDPTARRVLLTCAIVVSLVYGIANAFAFRILRPQMTLIHTLSARLAASADLGTEAAEIYAERRRFVTIGAIASYGVGALFVGILLYLLLGA